MRHFHSTAASIGTGLRPQFLPRSIDFSRPGLIGGALKHRRSGYGPRVADERPLGGSAHSRPTWKTKTLISSKET